MRFWIFFIVFSIAVSAQAQMRYGFGPKKGELVETEEMKDEQFRTQSLQTLQKLEAEAAAQRGLLQQQIELLQQMNQLLTTQLQMQQQQLQLQSIPLQQQAIPPMVNPLPSANESTLQ